MTTQTQPLRQTVYDAMIEADLPTEWCLVNRRKLEKFSAALLAADTRLQRQAKPPTKDDIEWVVNDNAELGVKIGDQFFWLYKGESLVYEEAAHDDGTPMMWRIVGKREFGECCHPVKFWKEGVLLPKRYTEELIYTHGLSFGTPEDGKWKPLPSANGTGGQA